MQHPVGYTIRNGRAEMTDFWALVGNTNVWYQFPHVLTAGISVGGFLVMGFSAYHLLKKNPQTQEFFQRSFRWAAVFALVGSVLVGLIGHFQGQFLETIQPMKISAMEAHWETTRRAPIHLFAIPDPENERNIIEIGTIPGILSFLG